MGAWNAQHRTGEKAANWRGGDVQVVCQMCNKTFGISPRRARREQKQVFCSRACKSKWASLHRSGANSCHWKGDELLVACATCGKEKRTESMHLRRNKQHFCCRKCRGTWLSLHASGENSPFWKGGEVEYRGPNWNQQQRAARKRDGYKCRHCGKVQKKNGRALDVHHIKPFREFGYIPGTNDNYLQANALTNLITLCNRCHKKAEHYKIAIQPYLL